MLPTYVHPSRLSDRNLIGRIRAMNERLGRDVFIRQNALDQPDDEAAPQSLMCPVLSITGRFAHAARAVAKDGLVPMARLLPTRRRSAHLSSLFEQHAVLGSDGQKGG